MVKKYRKKEDILPKGINYLGLGWRNWVLLKNGKSVELESLPKEAKDYLEEVKPKIKKEVK
jgi:hypothetical protein|tara:strand:+ start:594 stop:776 length:183 start_codon:yes stop_codon:yes gene_type:complete